MSNLIWRLGERMGAKGVEFVVALVLARLLEPAVFGNVALVTILIRIIQVFVDSGLGNALIQKKDADDLDFSTVFYFNILFCIVLYGLLFIFSPWIAEFYNAPELTPVIRALGITILISGVKNVQQAYVSRHMLFRKFFFATLGGTIGAAVLGIIMALRGYGIWALVAQQTFNVAMDTVILWITVKWRPKWCFSFSRLKQLYSYGWKLLASQLIDTFYSEIRSLIIGKIYSPSDLAYYNRAKQFPLFITSNVNTSINSVLFPAMSGEQDNKNRVRTMTRRAITVSTFVMAPLLFGLAACGEPIVRIILTEKWLPLLPYLTIFCISYVFLPIHSANLNAIKAMGRSDLFLKLEIIKKTIGLIALLITMRISVMAMAYSLLVTNFLNQLINTWPNRKLLGYKYRDQIMDIMPNILLAAFMAFCVYLLERLGLSQIATLTCQVLLGAILYIGCARITKNESYFYLLDIIKPHVKRFLKH